MLSILIPIYNYDVRKLVFELHRQAEEQMIDFEILAFEDGSIQYLLENSELAKLSNCHYKQNTVNVGRSVIRNRLAEEAQYEHLLFLDCDVLISTPCFIEKYISFIKENTIVLGGCIYEENTDFRYSLMKKYGQQRDGNDLESLKNKMKFPIFTTPNFFIPKKTFDTVRFNENIVGYGHEDTIFGIELKRKGFQYIFIDNPVVHIGLETNPDFLKKTRQALENLYKIYRSKKYVEIETQSKILKFYIQISPLTSLFAFIYRSLHKLMERNLISKHPSLRLFDFYKLTYLCYYAEQK